MHSILDSIFWSNFGRFLLPTSTPESQLNASRLAFSWFSASKVNIDFWSHFGTNLSRFWYPKSTKIQPKVDPKRHQFFDRFLHPFFFILAPSWDQSWGHVGHSFLKNGGTLWEAAPLFVGSMLFFDLLVVLAPSWLDLGSIFGMSQENQKSIKNKKNRVWATLKI